MRRVLSFLAFAAVAATIGAVQALALAGALGWMVVAS